MKDENISKEISKKEIKQEKKYEIVLARYKESLDWLNLIPSKSERNYIITVSNSGEPIKCPEADRVINIENVKNGREANHFLNFMFDKYDEILETTVFLQANPWGHARTEESVCSILELFYGKPEFKHPMAFIGRNKSCYNFKTPKWTEVEFVIKSGWQDKNLPEVKENLPEHTSDTAGQFYVKKNIILRQEKEHYLRIKNCGLDPDSKLAYVLEYYWPNVFDLSSIHE